MTVLALSPASDAFRLAQGTIMRPMFSMLLILCSALVVAAAQPESRIRRMPGAPVRTKPALVEIRVESSRSEDIAAMSEKIAAAVRSDEAWIRDPARIALELVRPAPPPGEHISHRLELTCETSRAEIPDSATVTVVEDGFLNDSVRGTWTRLQFARNEDGSWKLIELRRAWRCWRGHHMRSYSSELCL
jgi:hypothetical protein